MDDILATTRRLSGEIGDYLEACCETPLRFGGDDPNLHSYHNHIHLFRLIAARDEFRWIDAGYMTAFVRCIFDRWRARLKSMAPYRDRGYRLYLYQDFAPTISAVAETPEGFPYPGEPVHVDDPGRIMELYRDFSLARDLGAPVLRDSHILDAIERHAGSIGKPTAQALGLQVGALRRAIEWWDIHAQVNAIRKHHRRRPARFRDVRDMPFVFKVYEERLPPRY